MCTYEEKKRLERAFKNTEIISKVLCFTADILEDEPEEVRAAYVLSLMGPLDLWTDKKFMGMLANQYCKENEVDD